MSLMPRLPDGYYDDHGVWQRTKFCFVYCGAACTCGPPMGNWYSEHHDKSKQSDSEVEVKANIEVELQPFAVPNFVLTVQPPRPRQEGIVETPKLALTDLDSQTLERLCDAFRDEVFTKAGKSRPPQEGPRCSKCLGSL